MTDVIEKPLDEEEVVDQREVKPRNKWMAIVQLATDSSKPTTRVITDINSNYINSQIHNSSGTTAASTPNSAAGMARIIIPSSTTNNNLAAVKKEERFTVRVTARRSGGNSRAVGRGAK